MLKLTPRGPRLSLPFSVAPPKFCRRVWTMTSIRRVAHRTTQYFRPFSCCLLFLSNSTLFHRFLITCISPPRFFRSTSRTPPQKPEYGTDRSGVWKPEACRSKWVYWGIRHPAWHVCNARRKPSAFASSISRRLSNLANVLLIRSAKFGPLHS